MRYSCFCFFDFSFRRQRNFHRLKMTTKKQQKFGLQLSFNENLILSTWTMHRQKEITTGNDDRGWERKPLELNCPLRWWKHLKIKLYELNSEIVSKIIQHGKYHDAFFFTSLGSEMTTVRFIWEAKLLAGDIEQSLDGTLDANSPRIFIFLMKYCLFTGRVRISTRSVKTNYSYAIIDSVPIAGCSQLCCVSPNHLWEPLTPWRVILFQLMTCKLLGFHLGRSKSKNFASSSQTETTSSPVGRWEDSPASFRRTFSPIPRKFNSTYESKNYLEFLDIISSPFQLILLPKHEPYRIALRTKLMGYYRI